MSSVTRAVLWASDSVKGSNAVLHSSSSSSFSLGTNYVCIERAGQSLAILQLNSQHSIAEDEKQRDISSSICPNCDKQSLPILLVSPKLIEKLFGSSPHSPTHLVRAITLPAPQPPFLDSLILKATTAESYQFAIEHRDNLSQVLASSSSSQLINLGLLLEFNSSASQPLEFETLEASPCRRGLISSSTAVIVLPPSASQSSIALSPPSTPSTSLPASKSCILCCDPLHSLSASSSSSSLPSLSQQLTPSSSVSISDAIPLLPSSHSSSSLASLASSSSSSASSSSSSILSSSIFSFGASPLVSRALSKLSQPPISTPSIAQSIASVSDKAKSPSDPSKSGFGLIANAILSASGMPPTVAAAVAPPPPAPELLDISSRPMGTHEFRIARLFAADECCSRTLRSSSCIDDSNLALLILPPSSSSSSSSPLSQVSPKKISKWTTVIEPLTKARRTVLLSTISFTESVHLFGTSFASAAFSSSSFSEPLLLLSPVLSFNFGFTRSRSSSRSHSSSRKKSTPLRRLLLLLDTSPLSSSSSSQSLFKACTCASSLSSSYTSSSSSASHGLPTAKHVSLEAIRTPSLSGSTSSPLNAKRALACYFAKSRVVAEGDVLLVPCDESHLESVYADMVSEPDFRISYEACLTEEIRSGRAQAASMEAMLAREAGGAGGGGGAGGAKGSEQDEQQLVVPMGKSGDWSETPLEGAPSVLYYRVASIVTESPAGQGSDGASIYSGLSGLSSSVNHHGVIPSAKCHMADIIRSTVVERGSGFNAYVPPETTYLHEHPSKASHPTDVYRETPMYEELKRCVQLAKDGVLPSAAVFIHGARGSGKRLAVRAAADAVGMHVLQVNCFELLSSSPQQTDAALQNITRYAKDCSPCVLHLRNIQALCPSSASSASSSPSSGSGSGSGGGGGGGGGAGGGGQPGQSAHASQSMTARVVQLFRSLIFSSSRPVSASSTPRTGAKPAPPSSSFPVVLICSAPSQDAIAPTLRHIFPAVVHAEHPDASQREQILRTLFNQDKRVPSGRDLSLAHVARQTAGATLFDLRRVASSMFSASLDRSSARFASHVMSSTRPLDADLASWCCGLNVSAADAEAALTGFRAEIAQDLGAPRVPSVTWDDVGGLAHAKRELMDVVQLPLIHPELFDGGLKQRSGVLLYGPPGTGKTLLAKAVATECALNFLSVKGPELINMYVGESEKNVRDLFAKAREARPCVIFMDEIDALVPSRGVAGDSGGVMDRVVSQLLAELDGAQQTRDVFVIGATNRPDLIDPALLRPGRFDRLVYLGVSSTAEDKLRIVQALTRKFLLAPDVELMSVVKSCPPGLTGADMYALCCDAFMSAVLRQVESSGEKDDGMALVSSSSAAAGSKHDADVEDNEEEVKVVVEMADFLRAASSITPSLSVEELARYDDLQKGFKDGGKARK